MRAWLKTNILNARGGWRRTLALNHPARVERTVHGTAVRLGGRGVLILGASGSGKSRLALRLIARGGDLIADDRVVIARGRRSLYAAAPAALAGLVEARSVGILRMRRRARSARLDLVVDLDAAADARLPQRRKIALLGRELELIRGRSVPDLDVIITVLMQKGAALR
jgi:HPr kinase/phosphorylase